MSDQKFDPKVYYNDPKEVKRNDRYTHFAVAASKMAMEDAGVSHSFRVSRASARLFIPCERHCVRLTGSTVGSFFQTDVARERKAGPVIHQLLSVNS